MVKNTQESVSMAISLFYDSMSRTLVESDVLRSYDQSEALRLISL